jgi:hypothetical protein
MKHILKNDLLEIQIDSPTSNYKFSRFDWTGKIVSLKYKSTSISGFECSISQDDTKAGKGFYNEFGFRTAIGYDETEVGDWFHKIGIGLLQKENGHYLFHKSYEMQPAHFTVAAQPDKIIITCNSQLVNGYSYVLIKEIQLVENSFIIHYNLKNTGIKTIITDEYTHNFITIDKELIGTDYVLKFPFEIKPKLFEENVNPERKVEIGSSDIRFNATPEEPFFFSNLSGNEEIEASWELLNTKSKIGIRETGSFKTNKVNLWGCNHVISPELYFDISVEPGKEVEWSRTYTVFDID